MKRIGKMVTVVLIVGVGAGLIMVTDAFDAPAGPTDDTLQTLLERPMPEGVPVEVATLSRNAEVSVQFVRIRSAVPPHRHARHAESILIIAGSGRFRIGDAVYPADPGDVFTVPIGTVHAFEVTGEEPAVAVTTFTPPFDGKDRIAVSADESGN